MPIFSIIMPVYNNERYFPLAVQSVLSQNYDSLELIIIDDGSTDKTPQIADSIAKDDTRVNVVHQENQWIYSSLNYGIEISKGDYILFVNSDDKLRPESLKKLAEKIKRYNPDVIWTKVLTHKCDENQNILDFDCNGFDKKVDRDIFLKNRDEFRNKWLYLNQSCLTSNQINVYKSDIAKKHKFRNDMYGADKLYNISIAPEIQSAYILKEAIYDHFNYDSDDMNISIGKYYEYEHDMFNLLYYENKKLLDNWDRLNNESIDYLTSTRLRELSKEIRSLNSKNCVLTLEKKIQKVLSINVDNDVYELASQCGKVEELEARVLSGLRGLLVREELSKQSELFFIYELIECLLIYEKGKEDFDKIKNAVYHPLNKFHIGQCFYKRLIGDKEDV